MTDKVGLVGRLMALPRETRQVEFKAARNQYSHDRAAEYCAALANEGGGHLVLGVTDRTPRRACGTQAFRNPQELERKLYEKLGLRVEVDELTIDGSRVVLVSVGARPAGRPVGLNGRYLMRQGESLVDMTPDHLQAIFAEPEPAPLDAVQISDLRPGDVVELLDTDAFFSKAKDPPAADLAGRCRALAASGVLNDDAGAFGITGLGAVLFARRMADFPRIGDRRLRFIHYGGTTRTSARRDVITDRGYALEFEPLLEMVAAWLPVEERISSPRRESVPVYHGTTLRELVANAIVHQDFRAQPALIAIELYEDRIEVTNAGTPLIDPRRFAVDTRPRNLPLSLMMRDLGMCESRGSGIQRALEQNEAIGAADPSFHTGSGLTKAVLIGKHDFMTMSGAERSWAIFMHACRMWAGHRPMSNASFRQRYALADRRSSLVSIHFQHAMDEGLIVPQDSESSSKRYARYVPFYATA